MLNILLITFTLISQFSFGHQVLNSNDQYYSRAVDYKKVPDEKIERDTKQLSIEPIEFVQDSSFTFDKLIFHTSACFGSCPVINLEILSDKSIRFTGNYFKDENFNETDSARYGNFSGQLSDQLYNELIDLIITSKITEMENKQNQVLCCDAAVKTLILYHNDTRKYYKAMFEPSVLRNLISFLYSINQNLDLTQVEDNFYFEK
ncbi:hypothetical protein SAMN04489724_4687 [Algoriphagus locisalis]|uniref:DUF6438 domain-containing protein n=1 Tax=Algoriphagus locisalis TaxID=305507 RepID=A0A1I7E186_9BACT|nr:DUF6438 domain-containing protein [Algoriphagus locisalis]SFU17681.1 hypothetical protein SAMN04489724_4687 [Algoriphagus locisalis]